MTASEPNMTDASGFVEALPPSYEFAVGSPGDAESSSGSSSGNPGPGADSKVTSTPKATSRPDAAHAGSSSTTPFTMPAMPETTVYHYVHPVTQERIVSLLPPDHPSMICLQEGRHLTETRFGFLGILAAVFWFPLGIGLCLLDRRVRCHRCGQLISDGICG